MAYRLTRDAEAGLDEIWSYIAQESGVPDIAHHLVKSIAERFDVLAARPRMGRARNDLRRGLRSHPVGNYIIFYRIVGTDVVIIRVLHGGRDIAALFPGR
jgi:toxin ParE1/3/4